MDLNQLRTFLTACDELHFGRAAEKLGIAQPALSQQIKSLEARLGVQLFDRAHRRIELTEAGTVFCREARTVVGAMDRAINLARASARGVAGELHVGYVGSAIADPCLSQHLQCFMSTYPNVQLTMHENTPQNLFDAVEAGRLHVALIRGPISTIGIAFDSLRLTRTRLSIALPPDHPLARETGLSIGALSGETFVTYPDPDGIGIGFSLRELCAKNGYSPRIGITGGSVSAVLSLVSCGHGIALIPSFSVHPGVVVKPLYDEDAWSDIFLVRKAGPTGGIEHQFAKIFLPEPMAD